jgi:hypothetical protein
MALEVVMSKEREMIEKLCSFQMTYSDWLLLIADAEELLAQPEQEPVAWMYDWKNEIGEIVKGVYVGSHKASHLYELENLQPLYLAPQKREPLSEERLEFLVDKYHGYPMTLGRTIEKAHGIGGGE